MVAWTGASDSARRGPNYDDFQLETSTSTRTSTRSSQHDKTSIRSFTNFTTWKTTTWKTWLNFLLKKWRRMTYLSDNFVEISRTLIKLLRSAPWNFWIQKQKQKSYNIISFVLYNAILPKLHGGAGHWTRVVLTIITNSHNNFFRSAHKNAGWHKYINRACAPAFACLPLMEK